MMKIKKSTSLFLATLALAGTLVTAGCGKMHIGSVDEQRVSKEAPQIKSLVDERDEKVQAEIDAFQKKMQESPDMSQEDAQKAQMETQRKIQALQQSYQLQMKQKADVVYQQITKDKKLDAIVESVKDQPLAYYGTVDVTDDVINKLQ